MHLDMITTERFQIFLAYTHRRKLLHFLMQQKSQCHPDTLYVRSLNLHLHDLLTVALSYSLLCPLTLTHIFNLRNVERCKERCIFFFECELMEYLHFLFSPFYVPSKQNSPWSLNNRYESKLGLPMIFRKKLVCDIIM